MKAIPILPCLVFVTCSLLTSALPAAITSDSDDSAPVVPPRSSGPASKGTASGTKPAAVASGQKPPAVVPGLAGTWRFMNQENGWSGTRSFKDDGTFIGEGVPGVGTWAQDGDKVILTYPNGSKDQMLLPLDPKNTQVIIRRGQKIFAFKEAAQPGPAGALTTRPAVVEVQEATLSPLAKDELVWTDRTNVVFTEVPTMFQGYKFTRRNAHDAILRFKVTADGWVYMACTTRWVQPWAKESDYWDEKATSEEKLWKDGWEPQRSTEILTTAADTSWHIFSRYCKTGEEFAYRTEKYTSPILLIK